NAALAAYDGRRMADDARTDWRCHGCQSPRQASSERGVRRVVDEPSRSARETVRATREVSDARGCDARPWGLSMLRLVLLLQCGVVDPGTLAATCRAEAALPEFFESWRPPSSKATLCLPTEAPSREGADGEIYRAGCSCGKYDVRGGEL